MAVSEVAFLGGKGWDTRQGKEEEKEKIIAGVRRAGSKRVQGGQRRGRMGEVRLGEDGRSGWSWEVKENERTVRKGGVR